MTEVAAIPDVDVKAVVKDFLAETSMLEREAEIERVLKAFQFNPFDLMNVPTTATQDDIKRQYRHLSLLCHPDKCRPEARDKAQKAFTLLAKAKADLTEDDKRPEVDLIVIAAREAVTTRKQQANAKARKERAKERARLIAENSSLLSQGDATKEIPPEDPTEKPDVTLEPDFEEMVKQEIKEKIIEREWRKRQMMKAAQAEEEKMAAENAEKQAKIQEEKDRKDQWESGRENRVNSWRDFKKSKGTKLKYKGPQIRAEDEQHTYVRRPVQKKNAF
jgi:DnaJ family protein C protein 8